MHNKDKKKLTMAGVSLVAAILIFIGIRCCLTDQSAGDMTDVSSTGQEEKTKVAMFGVKKAHLYDAIEGLVGTIKGDTIDLTFNGQEERLSHIHVKVGQVVKSGTTLFELDHTRAEAKKNQAEIAYNRMQQLQEAGGATSQDVKEAKANYDIALQDYEDTFIRAPKKGYVSEINSRVGETISRSDIIGVLVSSEDDLFMETGVIESQLGQVYRGQKSDIQLQAFGDLSLTGKVSGVSREVSTTGRTGTVVIALPRNIQSKLRPGLSAKCRIVTYDGDTLVIPRQAYDTDNKGVYVVNDKDMAVFTRIQLGHVTRDHYEVIKGLNDGDKIVADLVANPVQDNTPVAIEGDLQHYTPPEQK